MIKMMFSPKNPTFFSRRHVRTGLLPLGLAMACLAGNLSTAPTSLAATQSEICKEDASPADALWTCIAPPAVPPLPAANAVTTIFWAPRTCSPDIEAATPNITNLRFVLYNTKPSVVLSALGSSNHDIMVGSPGTSDDLQGMSGKNTFIVGGQTSYLLGRGDRAFVYSTSGETDWVGLSSTSAEFIHISSSMQSTPGSLALASMTGLQPVRGSNEISGTITTCITPKLLRLNVSGSSTHPGTPLLLSQSEHSEMDWSLVIARQNRARKGFLGIPTLQGFDISRDSKKRILLPANDYLFNGRSLAEKSLIPTLVASRGVRVAAPILVKQDKLDTLIANAVGLSMANTDTPLVYFPEDGLLVFSQNSNPLGSRSNPGRVIARLLHRDGSPLKAPVANGRVFEARFIRFTSQQRR
jgi:hypothetical protein